MEVKKRLLLSKWRGLQMDAQDKIDELQEQIDAHESETSDLVDALVAVKYWLHDGLVMHRLVSNPRDILRKVEDAIS